VSSDELVLCHGASQGIALALRLFCAPGDAVAVEEPTYNNVLGAALAPRLRVAPVPMTDARSRSRADSSRRSHAPT
jgi:DNA-binding transcriptional MocR family regulator